MVGRGGADAGSPESARWRSALRGCMTQARWAWNDLSGRSTRCGSSNRNAVPACSPRVPSLSEAPLGIRCRLPCPVCGPHRGPVTGDSVSQGRSGDGTALRFVLRRGAWVARFPGERSLSLGTPGLHDESPLGFWLERRTCLSWTGPLLSVARKTDLHSSEACGRVQQRSKPPFPIRCRLNICERPLSPRMPSRKPSQHLIAQRIFPNPSGAHWI